MADTNSTRTSELFHCVEIRKSLTLGLQEIFSTTKFTRKLTDSSRDFTQI